MRKIGFIGCYDKTDLILYVAKILVAAGERVLMVDTTVGQKAKYVVPVIKTTPSYVTEFEGIDVAVGFQDFNAIKRYLGTPEMAELGYDIALIDVDNSDAIENFDILQAEKNYFVTAFDAYSLKKGLEILGALTQMIRLTKVLYSRNMTKAENEYLDYLASEYKVEWEEDGVYFPFEVGDQSVIAENQRVSKIKFKKLSIQYKEALIYIADQLLEQYKYSEIKKLFKRIERGV